MAPTISFTVNPVNGIESEKTVLTFRFELSEPPPAAGVTVAVKGDRPQSLNNLDLFNISVTGGDFPVGDFDFTGFDFTIRADVATISVPVFDNPEGPEPLFDGLRTVTYTLQSGSGYTPSAQASSVVINYADDPSQIPDDSDDDPNQPPIPDDSDDNPNQPPISPDPSGRIIGTREGDRLVGTRSGDRIVGLAGDDKLIGKAGNDKLFGRAGNDKLFGRAGDDRLKGNNGSDRLKGGNGDDKLIGKAGDDRLKGNSGSDRLKGGNGDDVLMGGRGNDILIGGKGEDVLVLERGPGQAKIRGFQDGQDHLRLRGGLRFNRLTIEQVRRNTIISQGNDVVGVLVGIDADAITAADFT